MNEKIVELKDDAFDSCIASDSSNNQPVLIKKSGEVIAEFILKPISQGELMAMEMPDRKYDLMKGLALTIIQYKIKALNGNWTEGTKITEALLKDLQPLIFNILSETLLRMTYLLPAEEKN